jgi:hypothetical protein
VLGSSNASAGDPRVSLQARSCHKEDSTRGFIAPSLKPRIEFSSDTLPKTLGGPNPERTMPRSGRMGRTAGAMQEPTPGLRRTVVYWSEMCGLGSIEIGALGSVNTLPFDHKSVSPESQSDLLPDINKPPRIHLPRRSANRGKGKGRYSQQPRPYGPLGYPIPRTLPLGRCHRMYSRELQGVASELLDLRCGYRL